MMITMNTNLPSDVISGYDHNRQFPAWLGKVRQEAIQHFHKLTLPTKKDEKWKYVDFPSTLVEWPVVEDQAVFNETVISLVAEKIGEIQSESYLVFVNGEYVPQLSRFSPENSRPLSLEIPETFLDMLHSIENEDIFESINTIRFTDGVLVNVDQEQTADLDVIWVTVPSAKEISFHPRNCFKLDKNAALNIRIHSISTGENSYFMNAVSLVEVGNGAKLNLSFFANESDAAIHFSKFFITCAENAVVKVANFNAAVGLSRTEIDVDFLGPNAVAEILGLNYLVRSQTVHQVASVNHVVGECHCEQVVKSILDNESCTDYYSTVNVAVGAQLTVSNQLNQTLMLSDNAESYSRPQLNIDADDVKCGHGATVGQLEPGELFYLKSRGLSEAQGQLLLLKGFSQDVINRVEDPISRSLWTQFLADRLKF